LKVREPSSDTVNFQMEPFHLPAAEPGLGIASPRIEVLRYLLAYLAIRWLVGHYPSDVTQRRVLQEV